MPGEADGSSDQSAPGQRALELRLDARPQRLVRIANPRHVGRDIERRGQWSAALVRHRHTELAGDELRAEIVRMAAEGSGSVSLAEQRSQIGDEPIVPGHQLVELAA